MNNPFALDEKTFAVYRALLAGGEGISVSDIAKQTGYARPSIYGYLDQLVQAGAVEKLTHNNKSLYVARDPQFLSNYFEQQRIHMQSLEEFYQNPNPHHESAPKSGKRVSVFEGREQVAKLYDEMIAGNSVRAWFGLSKADGLEFDNIFFDVAERVREHKINMRDIISHHPEAKKWAKRMRRLAGPTYDYRLAPASAVLANDTIISGNVVAVFNIHADSFFAVRMEDPAIAESFRSMFELSWKGLK